MDNPKLFGAFLNGVLRRTFFEDESMTPEFLKEQVFPEDPVTVDELTELFQKCARLTQDAAQGDWELNEMENKLKETSFNEVQQQVMLRFWRNQKPKVHELVSQKSRWNNSLKLFSWRVDVKTKSKDNASSKDEINEPTAIIELVLGKSKPSLDDTEQSTDDRVVRLEMSRDQLMETVYHINQIQTRIEEITGGAN